MAPYVTIEDVATTVAALEAQCLEASANKVRNHLGRGSKETIVKLLRQLRERDAETAGASVEITKALDSAPPAPVVPAGASDPEPWRGRVGLPPGEDIRPRRASPPAPSPPPPPAPTAAPVPVVQSDASDPAPPAPVVPPAPLIAQAQQRVEDARRAEHAARRAWDVSRSNVVLDAELRAAQKAHRQAFDWLAQVERSAAALRQAIPEAQHTLTLAESQLVVAEQAARAMLERARRHVDVARADLARLETDLQQVVGSAEMGESPEGDERCAHALMG